MVGAGAEGEGGAEATASRDTPIQPETKCPMMMTWQSPTLVSAQFTIFETMMILRVIIYEDFRHSRVG